MLSIRFYPVGRKHQRSYRIVVDEKRSKLKGKFIEDLGWYNPFTKQYSLKQDRLKFFLGHGAQPSDTVYNLLVRAGVIKGKKRPVHKKKKVKEETSKKEVKAESEKITESSQPTQETKSEEVKEAT